MKKPDVLSIVILSIAAVFLFLLYLILAGCSMLLLSDETIYVEIEKTEKLLLVVDEALYPSLESTIDQYMYEVEEKGCLVELATWKGGTVSDLKSIIQNAYDEKVIGGAFLVGHLPAFWYEQNSFGKHEEFPCDLYFMDLDAAWEDRDEDGIYDYHTSLNLDIFISRVAGTVQELNGYFSKVHSYRAGGLPMSKSAYIFKDDDWSDYERGSKFGLSDIYESIKISEVPGETVKSNYLLKLTDSGAEYVYQWIHAYPPLLCIEDNGSFEYVFTSDISSNNTKGLFYNLFNCSASRFTETNLAMTYLLNTDYGLATHGSTKVGGNYYPKVFHYVLSRGGSWGEAYKAWYNNYGVSDDKWFMGMVILGDPMLYLTKAVPKVIKAEPMTSIPPSSEEIEKLIELFFNFEKDYGETTFEQYKSENPQFFPG